MNQQENQERANQSVEVEDLTVDTAAQQEVKGGNRGNGNAYFTNDYSLTVSNL
jgi:hypothetical protein